MSKQAILAALSNSAMADIAMPDFTMPVTTTRGPFDHGNVPTQDALEQQLEKSLSAVAGKLELGGVEALKAHSEYLMAAGKAVLSLLDEVPGNRTLTASPHALADIDFAIISGEFAVAENGAVWIVDRALTQGEHTCRIAPFICENLLLAVRRSTIVADMHEAMRHIGTLKDEQQFGVFVAGPSKTADIEQALVVGAHGACSLSLFLI